jgi:hypothetical protein
MTLLRVTARVELLSLLLLFANLATVHVSWVATLLGPLHGCAYLLVIGATVAATRSIRPRLLSLVPGIGGLLALRAMRGSPGVEAEVGRSGTAERREER